MKCPNCGGTYEKIQADGSEYYHVCPPRKIKTSLYDPLKDTTTYTFENIIVRDERIIPDENKEGLQNRIKEELATNKDAEVVHVTQKTRVKAP